MSKTLTEQLRNGTLKDRFYYFSYKTGTRICIGRPFTFNMVAALDIEDVLSPVPTYNHFVELTKKAKKVEKLEKENAELVTKCHRLEKLLKRYRDSVEFDKKTEEI